jgi:hypothetical protein
MSKKGAQLIAGGLYVKHVLEHLKTSGRRGLIKLIVCLFAGLQTNVYCPGNIRASAAGTYGDESERGLRVAIQCSKSVESVNLEQFECEQRRNITMPVELMDAIDGANAMSSSSPDRTARAED